MRSSSEELELSHLINQAMPRLPIWMPPSVAYGLRKRLKAVISPGILLTIADRENYLRRSLSFLELITPAFESDVLEDFWIDLDKKSSFGCSKYVVELTTFEEIFRHFDSIYYFEEIDYVEAQILPVMDDLSRKIISFYKKDQRVFKGVDMKSFITTLEENIALVNKNLITEKSRAKKDKKDFMTSQMINRERKSPDAIARYFVRRNNDVFLAQFKKPLHRQNVTIVNFLFETAFSYNDAAKLSSAIM